MPNDHKETEDGAMLFIQQIVLGNPSKSPAEIQEAIIESIAGAEPGSPLAAIGETMLRIGAETAIAEVMLQEAQSEQFCAEDCLAEVAFGGSVRPALRKIKPVLRVVK